MERIEARIFSEAGRCRQPKLAIVNEYAPEWRMLAAARRLARSAPTDRVGQENAEARACMPSDRASLERGLSIIRRRRRIMWGLWLAYLPAMIVFWRLVASPEREGVVAAIVWDYCRARLHGRFDQCGKRPRKGFVVCSQHGGGHAVRERNGLRLAPVEAERLSGLARRIKRDGKADLATIPSFFPWLQERVAALKNTRIGLSPRRHRRADGAA